jgi:hypothetical protein
MQTNQNDGSPSKLSRRRRRFDAITCKYVSPIQISKAKMKICLCFLAMSIIIGVHLHNNTKFLGRYMPPTMRVSLPYTNISSISRSSEASGNRTTLALLYPPGLIGGYRNQVLRFIAFVVYAKQNNISQLLLPSLLWTTKMDDPGMNNTETSDIQQRDFPIPFHWIFDVDHWNTFHENLPILVNPYRMLSLQKHDCWIEASEMNNIYHLHNQAGQKVGNRNNSSHILYYEHDPTPINSTDAFGKPVFINHLQRAVLLQGAIRPIAGNITIPILTNQHGINPRKHNFAVNTDHCINPRVFGGGMKAGVLWNAYISYQKRADTTTMLSNGNKSYVPFDTDIWIYRALRPAKIWRELADECITTRAPTGKYIAVHARLELEMMGHVCGRTMEKNLTVILQQINRLYNEQPQPRKVLMSGLFIAVSRDGMEVTDNYRKSPFRTFAEDNIQTLDRITRSQQAPNPSTVLPAFECGEKLLQRYYIKNANIPDHGSLLQSVINFYISVSSDVFIGVAQSSYSTDILTTRYWLGKGSSNYRYTPTGIEAVENGGLPTPHSNCKRKSS